MINGTDTKSGQLKDYRNHLNYYDVLEQLNFQPSMMDGFLQVNARLSRNGFACGAELRLISLKKTAGFVGLAPRTKGLCAFGAIILYLIKETANAVHYPLS